MMTSNKNVFFLLTVALRFALTFGYCDFCTNNFAATASFGPVSSKNSFYVAQGLTCNAVYLEASSQSSPNSNACMNIKNKYRNTCCYSGGSSTSAPQVAPPTPANSGQGNNPVCKICGNNGQVTIPNTVIYSNYINGSPRCADLSTMGLNGQIGGAVCYPLQLYVQGPCGCSTSTGNSNGNGNVTPANNPSPSPPTPTNPTTGSIPDRVERPSDSTKDSMKVSSGRCRGCLRRRALRGETSDAVEVLETI